MVIKYRDRLIRADHIEYDKETGEVTANGHLHVSGGPNHEDITASHGTLNLEQQTGRFYDVKGSVGLKNSGHGDDDIRKQQSFSVYRADGGQDRPAVVRNL